jgi:hypothetical protein
VHGDDGGSGWRLAGVAVSLTHLWVKEVDSSECRDEKASEEICCFHTEVGGCRGDEVRDDPSEHDATSHGISRCSVRVLPYCTNIRVLYACRAEMEPKCERGIDGGAHRSRDTVYTCTVRLDRLT